MLFIVCKNFLFCPVTEFQILNDNTKNVKLSKNGVSLVKMADDRHTHTYTGGWVGRWVGVISSSGRMEEGTV